MLIYLFINHISTYSLEGCCLACLIFSPLLGGGGGTSTTSGDGGGTSTTSSEDSTLITSLSLQKKTKISVNILYISVQCKTQKMTSYHNLYITNLLIGTGLLTLQKKEQQTIKHFKRLYISNTTMEHIQTLANKQATTSTYVPCFSGMGSTMITIYN